MSRLRKFIPISHKLYQIELEYKADFQDILIALKNKKLQEALELYKGGLLLESELELIREIDALILETLRQAILKSNNVGFLLSLADLMPDDLEVLEAAVALLPINDPRSSLVQAAVIRLQKTW